jgi:hypothetical protein
MQQFAHTLQKMIDVGDCVISHKDDVYEIVRADEYAAFAAVMLFHDKDFGYIARDGNLIAIQGATTFVCYEVIEPSYCKDVLIGRLIKKEGL